MGKLVEYIVLFALRMADIIMDRLKIYQEDGVSTKLI